MIKVEHFSVIIKRQENLSLQQCGILTSVDSDQLVHPLLSIDTPNAVQSVA